MVAAAIDFSARSFPRSAWECIHGRSASRSFVHVTQSVTGCIPTQSVGTIYGVTMANALPDLKLLRIFVSVVRHQGSVSYTHLTLPTIYSV